MSNRKFVEKVPLIVDVPMRKGLVWSSGVSITRWGICGYYGSENVSQLGPDHHNECLSNAEGNVSRVA